jgi:phospholipase/carboxylesterase
VTDLDLLQHRIRPAAAEPEGALVLLHGRGADEHDLFPLLDALDPQRRLVGVTPRAPLALPPGGAHWYVVREVGFPDPETFWPTFERLCRWFDALPEALGVPRGRTVLGGFSQGTAMTYATAFAKGRERPAGIVAMSGFVPGVDGLEIDLSDVGGYPVAIAHGSQDPVISVRFGRDARARFEAAGADVLWRESPMAHTIDPRFVSDLVRWLPRVVPPAS